MGQGIVFRKDERPRVEFKDPVTKTGVITQKRSLKSGSLSNHLKGILSHGTGRGAYSGQRKFSSVAATGLGEELNFGDGEPCLRMDNKYFESSEEDEERKRPCSTHSSGH